MTERLGAIQLPRSENRSTLIHLPKSNRLILVLVEGHICPSGSPRPNIIHDRRSKVRLRDIAQVQRIDLLIKHGLLVLEFTLFLLSLVDPHEAFIEDAWSDTKLKLVLFDIVIEVFDYSDIWPLLMLHTDTDISSPQFMLL